MLCVACLHRALVVSDSDQISVGPEISELHDVTARAHTHTAKLFPPMCGGVALSTAHTRLHAHGCSRHSECMHDLLPGAMPFAQMAASWMCCKDFYGELFASRQLVGLPWRISFPSASGLAVSHAPYVAHQTERANHAIIIVIIASKAGSPVPVYYEIMMIGQAVGQIMMIVVNVWTC